MRKFFRVVSDALVWLGVVNAVLGIVALIFGDLPAVGWFVWGALGFIAASLCAAWLERRS